MKVKVIGIMVMLSLVCSANTFAALDCKDWLGTWDVKLTDDTTTVWEIDEVGTPSFPQSCKVTGTSTPEQGDPFPFQIMVISFANTKFLYTEEMVITQNSPNQELILNEAKDGFEAATSGDYLEYPLIGSGTKRTEDGGDNVTGECATIDPLSALPGETVDVAITVRNATLGAGATAAFNCSEITVNSTTVDSPTEISVNITVADDAAEKMCAVAITTPDQEITQGCSFTIGAAPVCTDADNDTYPAEEGCGKAVDCNDDDAAVNPGADEVCDEIDNDCDSQVDEGDVCVPVCEIAGVTPASISIGSGILPRIAYLTITGNEVAEFSNASTLTFDPAEGIFTLFKTGSGSTMNALILVWGAAKGEVAVTVDDCGGGSLELQ